MKFINLDNAVLIGPGSEWFWTAITGIMFAVTFLALYRQLPSSGRAPVDVGWVLGG